MQLTRDERGEAFRDDLGTFLEDHCPDELRSGRDFLGGFDGIPEWARRWQATLFDAGWMIPGYPPELGGRNATPAQTLIFLEELARRGIPRSIHFAGHAVVGPSLVEFGNDEQRALARAAIRGDTVWCIGMSEPNAGSDLAALSTHAVLDGESFIVNGQKVWTSFAAVAQKCFCYVRTDPTAAKHKGISVLIIEMDTPGVEVRPLKQVSGSSEFAEVFFTNAVVPRANLVGKLNDGWRITLGSLAHERGGLWVEGVFGALRAVDGLMGLAERRGVDDDPLVRRRLGEVYGRAAGLRALGYKGFSSLARGKPAPEHSFMKLAISELHQDLYQLALDLQGAYAAVVDPDWSDEGGRWQRTWLVTLAATIGGGTSEIQRNVIANRVLGLPRA